MLFLAHKSEPCQADHTNPDFYYQNMFRLFHLASNENKMKCVYCGSLKCDVFVSRALIH